MDVWTTTYLPALRAYYEMHGHLRASRRDGGRYAGLAGEDLFRLQGRWRSAGPRGPPEQGQQGQQGHPPARARQGQQEQQEQQEQQGQQAVAQELEAMGGLGPPEGYTPDYLAFMGFVPH